MWYPILNGRDIVSSNLNAKSPRKWLGVLITFKSYRAYHGVKYARKRVFYGPYILVKRQNLGFCPYTGLYGSEENCILAYITQCALLIPHSIASIDRLFSIVNRNENESSDRSRLNQKGTLSNIVAVILDCPDTSEAKCYDFKPE